MRNHLSQRLDSLNRLRKNNLPDVEILELEDGTYIAVFKNLNDQDIWGELFFAGFEPIVFLGRPAFELGRLH